MDGLMLSPEKLRRFPLFAGIDLTLIKALVMASEEITLKKGDQLFHEGDRADALYIILGGKVELWAEINAQRLARAHVATLVTGEVIGWSALVQPYIYTMGATAATNARLAKLDGARMCELMDQNPAVGYQLMRRMAQVIEERLTALCTRCVSLIEGDRWQSLGPPNGNGGVFLG